jgi:uncharacterized lipoprotein YmbA
VIRFARVAGLAGCAAAATLFACGSTRPAHFYRLAPAAPAERTAGASARPEMSIGVGPVTMPRWLEGPQIATVSGANEVFLDEFHRWAEPLPEAVPRLLADELAARLGTDRVAVFPWNRWPTMDAQVAVDIVRLEGRVGGECILEARYRLSRDGGAPTVFKGFSARRPAGADHAALVAAFNQCLTELAAALATDLLDS